MVLCREYLSGRWILAVKNVLRCCCYISYWDSRWPRPTYHFLILGYSDVSFPVQKRDSFSSSSFLITWIFGDWDLQLQQVRWEQDFSKKKTEERNQKLELQLILCLWKNGSRFFCAHWNSWFPIHWMEQRSSSELDLLKVYSSVW